MKKYLLMMAISMAFAFTACQPKESESKSDNKTESSQELSKVSVMYFHGDRRCPGCIAVGEVAEQAVKESFSDNDLVGFYEINIDKKENESIAEKYEIAGSGLVIDINGNVENITGFAFQNARAKPELLKEKIVELVNSGL